MPRRIAFLGLGLVGGSIARAVRSMDGTRPELVAWSPSGRGPDRATADGTIDRAAATIGDAVDGADLVVIAAPPLETAALVATLAADSAGRLRPTATVTDVASTKRSILARADATGLRFVGGHPMAGREIAGYDGADAALFEGRPWVVVPGSAAGVEDVARVRWLALACRARPMDLDARSHDEAVAGISHLPLVLAAALVESVAGSADVPREGWDVASALAASGWRDMTRLARGDVTMGAGILATNREAVATRLRVLRAVLDEWIGELAEADREDADPDRGQLPDPERLAARLRAARGRLE